ncbi:MAG: 2-oxoglutarate and iron-dependent oxygenase domain-containing protein [Hyphomicrobiaceae bacterium]|jgi:isopenicillin N synthase-like dioxygenase
MTDTVPVIDLSSLINGEEGSRFDAVTAAIADACRRWGFFQVVNHGIPAPLVDRVWQESRLFFALPMAEKRALSRTKENPRGYYDRELTKNARDLKEVFDFGLEPFPDLPSDHPKNRLPVDGHNQWPASLPALKSTMTTYFKACESLGRALLELFCLGLGAPRDRLSAYFGSDHTGFVRLNYYPLEDPLEPDQATAAAALGDMALHHHTDAGVLTILLQDDVGGLQVFAGGAWRDVEPIEGALVVNIGDMMQVWSNDEYRSPLHRVRPITDRPRLSLPFFFNPSYETDCAPLEPLVADDGAHYRPVNWGTFRQLRTDGDYADYGKEVQLDDYRPA